MNTAVSLIVIVLQDVCVLKATSFRQMVKPALTMMNVQRTTEDVKQFAQTLKVPLSAAVTVDIHCPLTCFLVKVCKLVY